MNARIIQHPKATVAIERAVAKSPEAAKLRDAICGAMHAYAEFLDKHTTGRARQGASCCCIVLYDRSILTMLKCNSDSDISLPRFC